MVSWTKAPLAWGRSDEGQVLQEQGEMDRRRPREGGGGGNYHLYCLRWKQTGQYVSG